MVGPNGDPVQYNYDEPIKLIPECDGVRILSNSSMEFLHRVPDSTLVFGIGSICRQQDDAHDHYDRPAKCKGTFHIPWNFSSCFAIWILDHIIILLPTVS